MGKIQLIIDNKIIEVEQGATILKAAHQAGIEIPTLCHMELHNMNIENKPGGCRICVVEVEGRRNLAPSCITCEPIRNGKKPSPESLPRRLLAAPAGSLISSRTGTPGFNS